MNDEQSRAALGALADALIPSAPERPSATDAGVIEVIVGRIAKLLPERIGLLNATLDACDLLGIGGALDELRARDPRHHDLVCETVAGAYFMNASVRELIGYPGQRQTPARTDEAALEALVAAVREGGFAPRGVEAAR